MTRRLKGEADAGRSALGVISMSRQLDGHSIALPATESLKACTLACLDNLLIDFVADVSERALVSLLI